MTTATVDQILTADHVRALRAADHYVSFYWQADATDSPKSYCRVSKRPKAEPGFDTSFAEPITAQIPLGDPVFVLYDVEQRQSRTEPSNCYAGVSSPKYSPEWVTAVGFIREGDVLIPEYRTGNYKSLIEAGIAFDEFLLRVRRGDRKTFTFYLDNRVCPLSSSARMIRP